MGKRKADFQINKDELEEEVEYRDEGGDFEKASEEELKKRKIFKRKVKAAPVNAGFSFSFTPATSQNVQEHATKETLKDTSKEDSIVSKVETEKPAPIEKEPQGFKFVFSSSSDDKNQSTSTELKGFSFPFNDQDSKKSEAGESNGFSFKFGTQDSTEEQETETSETKPSDFADVFKDAISKSTSNTSGNWDFSFNPSKTDANSDPSKWSFSALSSPSFNGGSDYVSPFNSVKSDEKSWTDGENYTPLESKAPATTQVKLNDKPLESGEENETCIHECPVKLFEYIEKDKEWKDRGVGTLKLNTDKDNRARLIMRTKETRVVKLNARIFNSMPCVLQNDKAIVLAVRNAATVETVKTEKSDQDVKNESEETPTLSQILLRMKEASDAKKIFDTIQKYSAAKE